MIRNLLICLVITLFKIMVKPIRTMKTSILLTVYSTMLIKIQYKAMLNLMKLKENEDLSSEKWKD